MHKVYVPFVYIYSQWQNLVSPMKLWIYWAYDENNETWNHNKSDIKYKAGVARYVETMKSY